MTWLRQHRNSALLVGLTLLLPLFLILKSLGGLVALGVEYASERGRIEPRVARLQGLLEQGDLLEARSQEAATRLREVAYGPEQEASALAASVQAEIRRVLDDAGLEVSNSQVLPTRRNEYFEQVAVKLTLKGPLTALNAALIDLAASRPQVFVESLDTFPVRASRRAKAAATPQSVTAVLQVMTLRQLPR